MDRYWDGKRDYPSYPYRDDLWSCGMSKKTAEELSRYLREGGKGSMWVKLVKGHWRRI